MSKSQTRSSISWRSIVARMAAGGTGRISMKPTSGVVTRSYVSNLRKGRIENPGFEKLRTIA